jgi:hypothetical protein
VTSWGNDARERIGRWCAQRWLEIAEVDVACWPRDLMGTQQSGCPIGTIAGPWWRTSALLQQRGRRLRESSMEIPTHRALKCAIAGLTASAMAHSPCGGASV